MVGLVNLPVNSGKKTVGGVGWEIVKKEELLEKEFFLSLTKNLREYISTITAWVGWLGV